MVCQTITECYGKARKERNTVTQKPKKRRSREAESQESCGWIVAGKVSSGDGKQVGSKDIICPLVPDVSPPVMKLN